jgi:CRISPR-associated endonuclease/helicase Cas3
MHMFNFLKSVQEIMKATPKLSEWLLNAANYLAHTRSGYQSEKLEEHVELVDSYFIKLCNTHNLDPVIDKLISSIVKASFSEESQAKIGEVIKVAFVNVIHFHDFGKVNPNFQADPKKMNNSLFKLIPNHPIDTQHSSLGAYLFIVKHLQEASTYKLHSRDLIKLNLIILLLSYPIFKHHAPELSDPVGNDIKFGDEVKAMKEYIKSYQFEIDPALEEKLPKSWRMKNGLFDNFDKIINADFSLYALIKLSFSLLTASDYLATHEYMSSSETSDFGVLNDRGRVSEIITHFRNYKHNKAVFESLNLFEFQHPKEMSLQNLNQLRREMSVELIKTIRANSDQRLFYIEAPTGGGKTNMSMITLTELWEQNPELNKVFYVFPFTTLITQTYQVLKEALGLQNDELIQLHSKAGFNSKQEASKDGEYGNEKKDFIDNLFSLYPVSVLSHVKFFDILKSNRKETNYILHRLANSVVIIDEIQTYNPAIWDKMLYHISQYAEYFNIRFVLMSATLPKISNLQIKLPDQVKFTDLLPNSKKYLQNPNFAQRVNFRFDLFKSETSLEQLAEHVINKSDAYAASNEKDKSVHTIVEFIYKKSASAFFDIIENLPHSFDHIFVLSGTILEPRRRYIINFLKNKANRNKNILLITTQVVEAGVDIDMDLGYKNISLIDSDEQLAGRVNRNADKKNCEVYLFSIDEARVLYGPDDRYKVTRERISNEEYADILIHKNFDKLYNLVFERIDNWNTKEQAQNFNSEYLGSGIKKMNFKIVNDKFKVIDQCNDSVFVPVALPVFVEGVEEGQMEQLFSSDDLVFLERFGGYNQGDTEIDGKVVWDIYTGFISNKKQVAKDKGFDIKEKVYFKILQSILSKFTFSIVSNSKLITKLKGFCLNGDHTYGYLYLSHLDKYSLESGLLESKFDETENYFL